MLELQYALHTQLGGHLVFLFACFSSQIVNVNSLNPFLHTYLPIQETLMKHQFRVSCRYLRLWKQESTIAKAGKVCIQWPDSRQEKQTKTKKKKMYSRTGLHSSQEPPSVILWQKIFLHSPDFCPILHSLAYSLKKAARGHRITWLSLDPAGFLKLLEKNLVSSHKVQGATVLQPAPLTALAHYVLQYWAYATAGPLQLQLSYPLYSHNPPLPAVHCWAQMSLAENSSKWPNALWRPSLTKLTLSMSSSETGFPGHNPETSPLYTSCNKDTRKGDIKTRLGFLTMISLRLRLGSWQWLPRKAISHTLLREDI